jgi:prolyl 4-hydroxylase
MEIVNIHEPNKNPHFIGAWTIEPLSLSDELITYFENNIIKQKLGVVGGGLDTDVKNSVDITIRPKDINNPGNEIFQEYFRKLFECHSNYISQWPFIKTIACRYEIGSFNLQRYMPGQHFKSIHTERSGLSSLHRVFAFMTYLNNVEDGGSTYFSHYDLEIHPKKGLTLIWPAEWTHAHRGNILIKGKKYIITGWINFCL